MKKFEHGGQIQKISNRLNCHPTDIIDFSANLNPIGPPAWLSEVINAQIATITHYPDPNCADLINTIARFHNVSIDQIIIGNGVTEILFALPNIIAAKRALICVPSYSDYQQSFKRTHTPIHFHYLNESDNFKIDIQDLSLSILKHDVVILANPNNPTGMTIDTKQLILIAQQYQSTTFIIDESFIDFVDNAKTIITHRPRNVIVLRSMTKIYAIAGLRIGYAIANSDIIDNLKSLIIPWSVNAIAQAVAKEALDDIDGDASYKDNTQIFVNAQRHLLINELNKISCLKTYPAKANYLLIRNNSSTISTKMIFEKLLQKRIAIRLCNNFKGLDHTFFRIAIREKEQNQILIRALNDILNDSH